MPDLALLPSGSKVFVDTNIFDLHFRLQSLSCSVFMQRIVDKEIEAYVNTQVLSDLLHKLMLAEAYSKQIIPKRMASQLKRRLQADRAVAAQLTEYQMQFEAVLDTGLKVLPLSKRLLKETKFERLTYSLMTGDSLHLGCMNRHAAPLRNLVTYDADFAHIPGLTVWEPTDVTSL